MSTTYVKRYFFQERKIRQRALVEFSRAIESDRLIVMTGSMTTESLGYPGWDKLLERYRRSALALLRRTSAAAGTPLVQSAVLDARRAIAAVFERCSNRSFDKRVAFSVIKEALRSIDDLRTPKSDPHDDDPLKRPLVWWLEKRASKLFIKPPRPERDDANTVQALLRSLGARRFVTLNYDLELEWATMIEPGATPSGAEPWLRQALRAGTIRRDACVPNLLTRQTSTGLMVHSDIFDRGRPDRLIELAVGNPAIDTHIFHLHGRACTAETMILGTRDYDRLYRRPDPSHLAFEQGMRVLFAGNPALFVGLGMSEAEVNATFQTFVSDNPYRYAAPLFLLWNTQRLNPCPSIREREKRAMRLDWIVRLGVFVIFDEDLQAPDLTTQVADARSAGTCLLRREHLRLLASTVDRLAEASQKIGRRTRQVGARFRSLESRVSVPHRGEPGDGGEQDVNVVPIWCRRLRQRGTRTSPWLNDVKERISGQAGLKPLVIIAPPGTGKGSLAEAVAYDPTICPGIAHRLLINVGFCYDTDSLSDALTRFMLGLQHEIVMPLRHSREHVMNHPEALAPLQRGMIVLNGIDRLFTLEGHPLSVEFDHLLRVFAGYAGELRIKLVLLGTERVSAYFDCIGFLIHRLRSSSDRSDAPPSRSIYLSQIVAAFDGLDVAAGAANLKLGAAARNRIDAAERFVTHPSAQRRATLRAYLDPVKLKDSVLGGRTHLGSTILRMMAFIGMPVEPVVLLHAPAIRDLFADATPDAAAAAVVDAIEALISLELVIEFTPFEDYHGIGDPWRRFGLHRTVLAELRERYGVPLNQSKRATAFNMSLYAAQPVDSDTPDPDVHAELGTLIDRLIGSYRDEPASAERLGTARCPLHDLIVEERADNYPPLEEDGEVLERLLAPASVAALRAALAVLRGYYSTTTLLSIDRGHRLAMEDQDGVLAEHGERLERLLRGYRKLTRFRTNYRRRLADLMNIRLDTAIEPAERKRFERELNGQIGPEPFYRDELVWIYNELGVVRLAQGDLYAAREAFHMALNVNRLVEFEDHSHNWRRIMLNIVLLEIERGRLAEAEEIMTALERSIDERKVSPGGGRLSHLVVDIYAARDDSAGRGHHHEPSCLHRDLSHEDILVTGLVQAMRGLAAHLRGHLRTARRHYQDGIRILRRLGEHRAYALFQRYHAQLLRSLGDMEAHRKEIDLAVAAAESVRQMDLAYAARMVKAEGERGREVQLRQAQDAQEYGRVTDIHRVRVDATARLARAKFASGDYETAYIHATEAMAIAARYGMSLRKILLRVLLGQILIRRGDPKSGQALIDTAIEHADRIGYQRAVALAQRIRAEFALSL